MKDEALALWDRSLRARKTAAQLLDEDPDGAASRAYYAAFCAVSALFAIEGRLFTKHSAVLAAVHRDLVRTGRLSPELGDAYSSLLDLRGVGDYGSKVHVQPEEAIEAVKRAGAVCEAIRMLAPDQFHEDKG